MSSDDEAGDADYEGLQWIGGEAFYTGRREKRKQTREDAIYGVFGEGTERGEGPVAKRSYRSRKEAEVEFVSSGVVQEGDATLHSAKGVEVSLPAKSTPPPTEAESTPLPTSFGQKIRDGAKKRQKAEEQRTELKKAWKDAESTGFASFEQHSRGIASKLMQKMGYKPGEGLGIRKQGMVAPIVQRMRPKSMGMGYGDFKERGLAPIPPPEVEADGKVVERRPQFWRAGGKARRKRTFKTAVEVLRESEQQWSAPVLPTVLDMRGPKARVLTDLTKLNTESTDDTRPMPELQHNVDLLVEMTETEIKNLSIQLKGLEDSMVLLQREEGRLQEDVSNGEHQLKRRLELQKALETEILPLDPVHQHRALMQRTERLRDAYFTEFDSCRVVTMVLSKVAAYFEKVFEKWNPLEEPERGVQDLMVWKELLTCHIKFKTPLEGDPFGLLLVQTVVPPLRSVIVNQWEPRRPEQLLGFLDAWKGLLHEDLVQYLCHGLVFPKLKSEIEAWNPRRDALPLHHWMHPWLVWMAPKLSQLYPTILHKLTLALEGWKPTDASALALLSPWKCVFSQSQWRDLLTKAILPKLAQSLQDYRVNPLSHDVTAVQGVLKWVDVIPEAHLVALLDGSFFPKWIKVLHQWLSHQPNLEEVSNWYMSWKSQFPEVLLNAPRIAEWYGKALDCMNRAAEGQILPPLSVLLRTEPEPRVTPPAVTSEAREVFTLRDMVQRFAEEQNVPFAPKLGRMHEGLQVYSFGGVSLVLDNAQNAVRGQFGQDWKPLSLEQLFLEMQNRK